MLFDVVIPLGPNEKKILKHKLSIQKKMLSDIEIYI
jgi:hypothetical protein